VEGGFSVRDNLTPSQQSEAIVIEVGVSAHIGVGEILQVEVYQFKEDHCLVFNNGPYLNIKHKLFFLLRILVRGAT